MKKKKTKPANPVAKAIATGEHGPPAKRTTIKNVKFKPIVPIT